MKKDGEIVGRYWYIWKKGETCVSSGNGNALRTEAMKKNKVHVIY